MSTKRPVKKAVATKRAPQKKKVVKQEPIPAKPFNTLPISTQTVMAYANCTFNIVNIFDNLPIEDTGITNMKKINGEHGKIYQLKRAGHVRGAPTKKGNFRNQITAYIWILDKMITVKIFPTGKFHLTGCKNLKHQQQAVVELMNHIRAIHTKDTPTYQILTKKLIGEWAEDPKVLSAKAEEWGVDVSKITAEIKASIDLSTQTIKEIKEIQIAEKKRLIIEELEQMLDDPLNIILEVVMVNVDFHLGFDVDQKKLDQLLQNESNEFYTIYETPVNTSVNIKLDYPDPDEKEYQQIVIKGSVKNPKVTFTTTGECPKARKKNTRTHTFLVFSSSKVIQSGRYYDSQMEPVYQKFHDFILKNRKHIELQLQEQRFDMSKLKGMRGNSSLQIKVPKNNKIQLS